MHIRSATIFLAALAMATPLQGNNSCCTNPCKDYTWMWSGLLGAAAGAATGAAVSHGKGSRGRTGSAPECILTSEPFTIVFDGPLGGSNLYTVSMYGPNCSLLLPVSGFDNPILEKGFDDATIYSNDDSSDCNFAVQEGTYTIVVCLADDSAEKKAPTITLNGTPFTPSKPAFSGEGDVITYTACFAPSAS